VLHRKTKCCAAAKMLQCRKNAAMQNAALRQNIRCDAAKMLRCGNCCNAEKNAALQRKNAALRKIWEMPESPCQ